MHVDRTFSTPRAMAVAAVLALTLSFAGCKKAASPVLSDATVTTALQNRLAGDGALSTESIQASVANGIATLNGTVSSDAARSLAAADAAQVPGIRTVVNNLTVQQPAPAPVAAAAPPPPAAVKTPAPKTIAPKKALAHKQKPTPEVPIVRQEPPVEQADAPPPPAPISRPAPPPAPSFRNVSIPTGTVIPIRITQTLDSATTQQGDKFTGTLAADIVIDGLTAIRQGTPVTGRVTDAQEAAHYKGSSLLSIELSSINRRGERITVTSDPFTVEGKGRGKNTAAKIGGGAAVGAILGGIFGGGKGAAIGAAAGGGVGAGANTITKGEQVQIPSESIIRFHLTNSIALRVPTGGSNDDNANAPGDGDQNPNPNPALQPRPAYQPPQ